MQSIWCKVKQKAWNSQKISYFLYVFEYHLWVSNVFASSRMVDNAEVAPVDTVTPDAPSDTTEVGTPIQPQATTEDSIQQENTTEATPQAKSLILLNIPSFWHLCHFSGINTRKAIDILLSGAYVTRFWMQKPTKEPIYSRFLSLMTLFGNKILFFPINSVPLHSRKLTLMTLFGNDYDYKKRLLFTATHIEQV